jgi:hypothetical protein
MGRWACSRRSVSAATTYCPAGQPLSRTRRPVVSKYHIPPASLLLKVGTPGCGYHGLAILRHDTYNHHMLALSASGRGNPDRGRATAGCHCRRRITFNGSPHCTVTRKSRHALLHSCFAALSADQARLRVLCEERQRGPGLSRQLRKLAGQNPRIARRDALRGQRRCGRC